jgi:hypothetical protein
MKSVSVNIFYSCVYLIYTVVTISLDWGLGMSVSQKQRAVPCARAVFFTARDLFSPQRVLNKIVHCKEENTLQAQDNR